MVRKPKKIQITQMPSSNLAKPGQRRKRIDEYLLKHPNMSINEAKRRLSLKGRNQKKKKPQSKHTSRMFQTGRHTEKNA